MHVREVDVGNEVKVRASRDVSVTVPNKYTCSASLAANDLADRVAVVQGKQVGGES